MALGKQANLDAEKKSVGANIYVETCPVPTEPKPQEAMQSDKEGRKVEGTKNTREDETEEKSMTEYESETTDLVALMAKKYGQNPKPQETKSQVKDWEIIEGKATYRTGAVMALHRKKSEQQSGECSEYEDQEGRMGAQSSQEKHGQESQSAELKPTKETTGEEGDEEHQGLEMILKARPNNMSRKEEADMLSMMGDRGYSHRSDFAGPNALNIYRCDYQGCGAILNPRWLERRARVHFARDDADLAEPLLVREEKWGETKGESGFATPPKNEAEERETPQGNQKRH